MSSKGEGCFDTAVFLLMGVTDRLPRAGCGGGRESLEIRLVAGLSLCRLGAIAEGELDDMLADIARPAGDETDEPPPVVGEQCPRGFLEAREIAGHHRHEMIGCVSCGAGAIQVATGAARFVHELSQRDRRTAGLRAKPFPVARQQRHLARHNAEFGPPAPARLRRRGAVGGSFRIRCRLANGPGCRVRCRGDRDRPVGRSRRQK